MQASIEKAEYACPFNLRDPVVVHFAVLDPMATASAIGKLTLRFCSLFSLNEVRYSTNHMTVVVEA